MNECELTLAPHWVEFARKREAVEELGYEAGLSSAAKLFANEEISALPVPEDDALFETHLAHAFEAGRIYEREFASRESKARRFEKGESVMIREDSGSWVAAKYEFLVQPPAMPAGHHSVYLDSGGGRRVVSSADIDVDIARDSK